MIASGQRDAGVTVGSLPATLTGAEFGRSALAVDTPYPIVIANWLQARVQGSFFILELRLSPSGLADDVALAVAHVPDGVLQVLRLAGVAVDVQGGEPQAPAVVDSDEEEDDESSLHRVDLDSEVQMRTKCSVELEW